MFNTSEFGKQTCLKVFEAISGKGFLTDRFERVSHWSNKNQSGLPEKISHSIRSDPQNVKFQFKVFLIEQ